METKKRFRDRVIYLFMPEDSSAGASCTSGPGQWAAGYPGWLGLLKAALWWMIAVGLCISILRQ